jgi:uncharacterized protein involved in exopolysaccharide biosynthesis
MTRQSRMWVCVLAVAVMVAIALTYVNEKNLYDAQSSLVITEARSRIKAGVNPETVEALEAYVKTHSASIDRKYMAFAVLTLAASALAFHLTRSAAKG